jgi:hypothetical protein
MAFQMQLYNVHKVNPALAEISVSYTVSKIKLASLT